MAGYRLCKQDKYIVWQEEGSVCHEIHPVRKLVYCVWQNEYE